MARLRRLAPWLLGAAAATFPVMGTAASVHRDPPPTRGPQIASVESRAAPASDSDDARPDVPDWPTHSGEPQGWHYSALRSIDTRTVRRLQVAWVRQYRTRVRIETTPIVAHGTMYVTIPPAASDGGHEMLVEALDAATGEPYWTYRWPVPDRLTLCCGPVNRGVAVRGDRVYVGTIDAHLIALDAMSGQLVWDRKVAAASDGYSITGAPLVVKDMVLTGVAGGEYGIRGFVAAYDAATGAPRWRFETIPRPGDAGSDTWTGDSWKAGGGSTWATGTYDPETDRVYWPVGNPGPDMDGSVRPGDNLYTNSIVALDADSGRLAWYFQFTPHDTHDWDAAEVPVLVDRTVDGRPRKLLVMANRNGFYYVLDRETGTFITARAFAKQTWAEGIDSAGRPEIRPGSAPTVGGSIAAPAGEGATNWWAPAYSPRTGLVYVNAYDAASRYYSAPVPYRAGAGYQAGFSTAVTEEEAGFPFRNAIRALDVSTGRLAWAYPIQPHEGPRGGVLATAGGLVFGSTPRGEFFALDAATGRALWHRYLGGPVVADPVAYQVGDRQFVAVAAGEAIFGFALPGQP